MSYVDEVTADSPSFWLKLDETSGTTATDSGTGRVPDMTGGGGAGTIVHHDAPYQGTVHLGVAKLGAGDVGTGVRFGDVGYTYDADSTAYTDDVPAGINLNDDNHDLCPDRNRTMEFDFAPPDGMVAAVAAVDPSKRSPYSDYAAYTVHRGGGAQIVTAYVYGTNDNLQNKAYFEVICYDASGNFVIVVSEAPTSGPMLFTVVQDCDAGLLTLYVNGEVGTGASFPDGEQYLGQAPMVGPASGSFWPNGGLGVGGYNTGGTQVSYAGQHGFTMASVAFFPQAHTAQRIAARYAAWASSFPVSTLQGSSNARARLEPSDQNFIFAAGAAAAGSQGSSSFQKLAGHYVAGQGSGQASGTAPRPTRTLTKVGTAPDPIVLSSSSGNMQVPSDMTLRLYDDTYSRTPTGATVTVYGAWPGRRIDFYYDNETTSSWTAYADNDGTLMATTIAVPSRLDKGNHVLHAISRGPGAGAAGDRSDSANFTVLHHPALLTDLGGDTSPIAVPGAQNADGSWNWTLQDLMPGGLGSYIMPRNPVTSERPSFTRTLTVAHSTAINGQNHLFEPINKVFEWTFTGTLFTQDEQDKLYAYLHLNRRIYIIDHMGRAWKSALTDVQIVPQLRKMAAVAGQTQAALTDWVADYTCTANVYDNQWYTPVPA